MNRQLNLKIIIKSVCLCNSILVLRHPEVGYVWFSGSMKTDNINIILILLRRLSLRWLGQFVTNPKIEIKREKISLVSLIIRSGRYFLIEKRVQEIMHLPNNIRNQGLSVKWYLRCAYAGRKWKVRKKSCIYDARAPDALAP